MSQLYDLPARTRSLTLIHTRTNATMNTEEVALAVFTALVQKLHTYGADDADRKKIAAMSFQYAEAFSVALEARNAKLGLSTPATAA